MQNSSSPVATPTLKRRLICLVYEAFLVTAVVMLAFFIFLFLTQKLDPRVVKYGGEIVLVATAGAYFIYCWTGSGHTLAMKTWRIKLVMLGHARVPFRAALVRYVFAWGWVLPGLATCWALRLTGKADVGKMLAVMAINIVAWGLTAFLDKDRQFLHDRLAGTRLISLPKKPLRAAKSAT
jgi:uncharacterized RDD family membrane protein YckC